MTRPSRALLCPRALAARVLTDWFSTGQFPDRLLESAAPAQRPFAMEIVYGCVRRSRELDWMLDRLVPRAPDDTVRALLHVGLYQLFHMDQTQAFAAVHETVEAARTLGRPHAAPMVNAVLRRAQREQADLARDLGQQPLALRLSHPDRLVERWTRRWSAEAAEALCAWNNQRARVQLRPVPSRISLPDYQARLHDAGIEATPHPHDPSRFLTLPGGTRVSALPGYDEGLFVVQDPATALAVDLLDVRPGLCILDACAAPGGKTLLIAEQMRRADDTLDGALFATDAHIDRLAILEENLRRLRRTDVHLRRLDATRPDALRELRDETAPAGFDRILLDVPCSNTGVIQRRPDARYRFDEARLASLVRTQQALLHAAVAVLRPGGRLVYSTCSLEPEENEQGVRQGLAGLSQWSLVEERTLFPPDTQTDGAYAAALTRS